MEYVALHRDGHQVDLPPTERRFVCNGESLLHFTRWGTEAAEGTMERLMGKFKPWGRLNDSPPTCILGTYIYTFLLMILLVTSFLSKIEPKGGTNKIWLSNIQNDSETS
jgi:hypothetical protein